MLRRTLSSLRWYAVNMWYWLGQPRARGPFGQGSVYIDLRTNLWHRYLHILVLFLLDQGYTVVFRHRWRFIGSWASYDMFRKSGRFHLTFKPHRNVQGPVITDTPVIGPHLLLDHDYFTLPGHQLKGIRIPMPMVDSQYIAGTHRAPPVDAERQRRRAVFFFGNTAPSAYYRNDPRTVFNCFTRPELLDLIKQRFHDRIHEPSGIAEIDDALDRDIVLLSRQKAYIPPIELNGVLARFDFMLAPSGLVMPLCHNLTEAMSAGCIPILQHAHLLDPPLRDGIECLSFTDEESLARAMERMRSMEQGDVLRMRKAVLVYCEQHLTPAAVITRLREAGWNGPLHLNAELPSVLRLHERMKAAGMQARHR
jgi:glycosyltransferase involved in cell wall biosynthesis